MFPYIEPSEGPTPKNNFGFRGLSFNVSYLPIVCPVVTGSLRQVNAQAVADRQPADEPILMPGDPVPPGAAGTRRRSRFIRSRIGHTSSVDEMGRHEYRIRGFICQWSPQSCNQALANAVFEHVNQNDVPFTGKDLGDDFHTLPGNNSIEHREEGARTTVNETLGGHIFHPGRVEHRVHFGNGNKTLYYDVTGEGSGPYPNLNNFLGRQTFEPGVREVLWL